MRKHQPVIKLYPRGGPGLTSTDKESAQRAGQGGQSHQIGDAMAELEKGKPVSLEELMVTTLAMADAVAKLLIEKE